MHVLVATFAAAALLGSPASRPRCVIVPGPSPAAHSSSSTAGAETMAVTIPRVSCLSDPHPISGSGGGNGVGSGAVPFTGLDTHRLVAEGLALAGAGAALLTLARRR